CSDHTQVLPSFPTRRSSDLGLLHIEHGTIVRLDRLEHFVGKAAGKRDAVHVDVEEGHEDADDETRLVVAFVSQGIPKRVWLRDADRKSTRLNSSHVAISYAV